METRQQADSSRQTPVQEDSDNEREQQRLQAHGHRENTRQLGECCFSHGQLHVGLPRVGCPQNLFVYVFTGKAHNTVYTELLNNISSNKKNYTQLIKQVLFFFQLTKTISS